MNRRAFLSAAAGTIAAARPATAARKPNIVYVMLDDLGYRDFGCYGQKKIFTPEIDRAAREGMRFTNAYAGAAVCAPSRAVLMTGLHAGHAPVRANAGTIPIAASDITVAEVLRQAGYATGGFGKWGLGDAGTTGIPTKQGFDEFFGYLHQVHAHSYYPEFLWDNDRKFELEKNRNGERNQYTADLIAERSLDFVRRHSNQPFFLYAPWTLPHGRFEVPDAGPYADEQWPEGHKTYAAMVTRADRHVGQLLRLLKELNLDRDTIVFITSDNGAHKGKEKGFEFFRSNGELRGEKGEVYEGGIRVPFIARWPGKISAGATSHHQLAFCDVLPTMAEIAGVKPPAGIDGISFLPALTGRNQRRHEFLYWEHNIYDQKQQKLRDERLAQAVRSGDYKLVRPNGNGPVELYNLRTDPGEKNDISARNAPVAQRLERIMQAARTEPRPHNTGSMRFVS